MIGESAPVLTIAHLRTLKIITKVAGAHSRDISKGMKVEVSSLEAPGAIAEGNVVGVETAKDVAEPVAQVEIHFDNTKEIFRPGMAATALISLEQREEILLLPRAAVVSAEGQDYVYKLVGKRAVRQGITLGNQWGGEIEIRNGLEEGDPVIVDNVNLLKAGSSVRVLATRAPSPAK
jgi:RND family efflux transporter MFP subunit